MKRTLAASIVKSVDGLNGVKLWWVEVGRREKGKLCDMLYFFSWIRIGERLAACDCLSAAGCEQSDSPDRCWIPFFPFFMRQVSKVNQLQIMWEVTMDCELCVNCYVKEWFGEVSSGLLLPKGGGQNPGNAPHCGASHR